MPGETLGIVGESGSGKSTVARLVLRLLDANGGACALDGDDITRVRGRALRRAAPAGADRVPGPVLVARPAHDGAGDRVGAVAHRRAARRGRDAGAARCSSSWASAPSTATATRTSSRAGNANASGSPGRWCSTPELLVLDEPVSALDGSVQAQILNLLVDLQERLGLTYVFISHDLAVVRHVADRIAVMHLGRIVETATAEELFARPAASVHAGVALGVARTRPGDRAATAPHRAARRPARRHRRAVGLPLPHPLLEGHRGVRGGRSAAQRRRSRPSRRLLAPGLNQWSPEGSAAVFARYNAPSTSEWRNRQTR